MPEEDVDPSGKDRTDTPVVPFIDPSPVVLPDMFREFLYRVS